ncbi:MAG: leucine-rich repeat domain-containing protein [Candidatus Thorarchaeota archaeon]
MRLVEVASEIFIHYLTTTGLEKSAKFRTDETVINLDLRDMVSVDLLPLIWCENLEALYLRNNVLSDIDLTPLEKCGKNLKVINLCHNRIQEIDMEALGSCPNLLEVKLNDNRLKRIDLSPLFQCANLAELGLDEEVSLTADLLLRSVGSWPEVLVERYHRILWKSDSIH